MSVEETYYWYSKCMGLDGNRARKAPEPPRRLRTRRDHFKTTGPHRGLATRRRTRDRVAPRADNQRRDPAALAYPRLVGTASAGSLCGVVLAGRVMPAWGTGGRTSPAEYEPFQSRCRQTFSTRDRWSGVPYVTTCPPNSGTATGFHLRNLGRPGDSSRNYDAAVAAGVKLGSQRIQLQAGVQEQRRVAPYHRATDLLRATWGDLSAVLTQRLAVGAHSVRICPLWPPDNCQRPERRGRRHPHHWSRGSRHVWSRHRSRAHKAMGDSVCRADR